MAFATPLVNLDIKRACRLDLKDPLSPIIFIDEGQYSFDIEVDGGINFSNSKIVLEAGADILVSGTTVFKENDGDIRTNIEKLKSM